MCVGVIGGGREGGRALSEDGKKERLKGTLTIFIILFYMQSSIFLYAGNLSKKETPMQ